MTMTAAELSNVPVPQLRRMLREKYPVCRGAFAANADKKDCITILTGLTPAKVVVESWKAAQAVGQTSDDQGETTEEPGHDLAEGEVHDDEPGEPVADERKAHINRLIAALSGLDPEGGKLLAERMAELDAIDTARKVATTHLVFADGHFEYGKRKYQVITEEPDDGAPQEVRINWNRVPQPDEHYNARLWRAECACGAVSFTQDANDLFDSIVADDRILLVGPPATGKTSIIRQFCAWTRWPMIRFAGARDITLQDFVGGYEARDGNTYWTDGPLPQAMKNGCVLVLDEVDHMPAECSSVLHSVMEPGGTLLITANGGELVKPHPNFRIVATANTAGFGDDSGAHPNAQVQDAAFLSRFTVVYRVTWMDPADEAALLVAVSGIRPDLAGLISKVALDTRAAAKSGDIIYPVTLRQTMKWAEKIEGLGVGNAFAVAVLNKLPPNDAAVTAEIAQRHLGERLVT